MKRMTMKFMALALLTFAGTASVFAQVAFNTSALNRQMRSEGLTEVAGSIQLTVATAGTILAGSSIDIVYSAPITNDGTGSTGNISLANNVICSGGCPALATLTGTNTVRLSFTADTPMAALDTIIIGEIRVNANSAASVGTVTATLSGTSPTLGSSITFNIPTHPVGQLNPTITGVRFNTSSSPVTFLQTCVFPNATTQSFRIRLDEGFPAALTTTTQESNASDHQAVDNGPILRITLTGVPAGVTITAPGSVNSTTADDAATAVTAGMLTTTTTSFDQTTAGAPIVIDYVVSASDPSQVERATIVFTIRATGTSTASTIALPSIGNAVNIQGSVQVTPITTTDTTVVRFATNNVGPTTLANITDCNTRLLLTWVATVGDVETGIAIANTSSDDAAFGSGSVSGATSQNGTCTLTGYPSAGGTPVSFTTATINAGSTLPFLLSATTGFSNFTGYILAVCNFQTAHAFTFITNGRGTVTGPTLAQGYVANVIPAGTRPGTGLTITGTQVAAGATFTGTASTATEILGN